ncbi:MAG: ATP-binding protein [Desulfovibrio sp.]
MDINTAQDFSIVAVDKFIHATRDSGYKDTSSAVAELIDNAIQAGATDIAIRISIDETIAEGPVVLMVIDNGTGMDTHTLRTALRFGGSTRFNDRNGLGRYGMGLPNSSLSQAKRVTVHTWRSKHGNVLTSYLDIDEIAVGSLTEVPLPIEVPRPNFINGHGSGTTVTWSRCDRLDNRRVSTLSRKMLLSIGRRFRHFLWNGVKIAINGDLVEPMDPLFLHPGAVLTGARQFGEDLVYEVAASSSDPSTIGIVRVRFSELPVEEWSKLTNNEKRTRGVAKGSGVSVVRGGREIDYGWFFLGGKRRENYDDWWRCEIQFDPILDEAFGISHTKQQIRPCPRLLEALSPDIESVAHTLNNRARKAHLSAKTVGRFRASELRASEKDGMLTPLPPTLRLRDEQVLNDLGKKYTPSSLSALAKAGQDPQAAQYRIVPAALNETPFFNYARDNGRLVLVLNPDHPFYKIVYKPLLEADSPREAELRVYIDLLLLAAARSEALLDDQDTIKVAESIRKGWSDTLATFLNR